MPIASVSSPAETDARYRTGVSRGSPATGRRILGEDGGMPRSLDTDVALRTDDLSLARSGVRVIDGITLTLPAGRTLVVRGATGAGKTSLVSLLAGHPDDGLTVVGGDARVHGISARRPGRARREWTFHTGYLPQGAGAGLPSRLTVQDVIAEPITSRDRRVNTRALAVRVATLLDEMELPLGTAPKYPYELSAGMRQRVALARALVLEPRLFVADDLYANLDVEVRAAARASIIRRRDERGWPRSSSRTTRMPRAIWTPTCSCCTPATPSPWDTATRRCSGHPTARPSDGFRPADFSAAPACC